MAVITVKAGKAHTLKLIYKDGTGAVIDITGGTARLMVRKSMYSPVLFTSNAVITGTFGMMEFPITPADTVDLLGKKCDDSFLCGVELLLNGDPIPFIEGSTFVVEQSVVR